MNNAVGMFPTLLPLFVLMSTVLRVAGLFRPSIELRVAYSMAGMIFGLCIMSFLSSGIMHCRDLTKRLFLLWMIPCRERALFSVKS